MKAIALFSGGLDSILAAVLIRSRGVEVLALNFTTPFTGRTRGRGGKLPARESARMLGLEYREIFIGDEYLEMVGNPGFGYGKNKNPCIDCKIFFIKKAGSLMEETGASFLVTGEVLGQRPMSQNRSALDVIAEKSGFGEVLLRPLSARLLPETLPERKGWVDRKSLFGFYGRGRGPQMDLAAKLGLARYPNASGGCLLTDPAFARKLTDLIENGILTLFHVELLKFGRHFRLDKDFKLVVGRDEEDNRNLKRMADGAAAAVFEPASDTGPFGAAFGKAGESRARLACRIMARYISGEGGRADVRISGAPEKEKTVTATGLADREIEKLRV